MQGAIFSTGEMEILNETLGRDAFPVMCALTRFAETGEEADIGSLYQGQRIAYLLLKLKMENSLQINIEAAAARKNHARKAAKARWARVRGTETEIDKADGNDLNGTEITRDAKPEQGSGSLLRDADTVHTCADVPDDADRACMGIPEDEDDSQTCAHVPEDDHDDLTRTGISEDAQNAQTGKVTLPKGADWACKGNPENADTVQTCAHVPENVCDARTCMDMPRDAENAQTGKVTLPKGAERACRSISEDAQNAPSLPYNNSSSCSLFNTFNKEKVNTEKDTSDTDNHNLNNTELDCYKPSACAREGEEDQWGHLGDMVSQEELETLRKQRTTEIPAIEQLMRDCGAVFAPADEDIARELLAEYSCETILRAIRAAKEGGKVTWRYIRGILRNWKESEQRDGGRNSGKGRGPAGSGETSGGAGKGSGNRDDSIGRTETSKHSDDLPEAARRYLQSILI